MYWVYGGYVVLSIVAFSLISVFNAVELAAGSAGLCVKCLRLHRPVLGNSPGPTSRLRGERVSNRLVAQAWLSYVDGSVRGIHHRLRICCISAREISICILEISRLNLGIQVVSLAPD